MNIIFEKETLNFKLKAAEFTEEPEELYELIKNELNLEEKNYYESIKNHNRKREWSGVRILIKDILGFYKPVKYDSTGNPFLDNEFHISITHSGNIAGVIISKNYETGIDLEILSNRILRTAHKFITEEELKQLSGKDEIKKIYLHWCSKEVLFKIKGEGGFDFKKDFRIKPFELKRSDIINTEIIKNESETHKLNYFFKNLKDREILIVYKG